MEQLNHVNYNAQIQYYGNVIEKNIYTNDHETFKSYRRFLTFKVCADNDYKCKLLFYRITADGYIQVSSSEISLLSSTRMLHSIESEKLQLEFQYPFDHRIPFKEFINNIIQERIDYCIHSEGFPFEPVSPFFNKNSWEKISETYINNHLEQFNKQYTHTLIQKYVQQGLQIVPLNILSTEWIVHYPKGIHKKTIINLITNDTCDIIPYYADNKNESRIFMAENDGMEEWYYQFKNCALYSHYRLKLCNDFDYHLNMPNDFFDIVDEETFLKSEVNCFPLFVASASGYLPFSPKNDPRFEGKIICILIREEVNNNEKCILIHKIKDGKYEFYRNMNMMENDSLEEKWERYNEMTIREHFQANMKYFKDPYYSELNDILHIINCN